MGSLNQHITPTGYRLGGTPVNENPFWEDGGSESKNITATASVDNTTGTPAVEVTKTETTEAVNFDFAFTGLKGEQGEKGDDGDTPEVSATAVVTDVGSTPSVSVINTGTTEAPNFQFTFDHIGGGGGGETDNAACTVISLKKDQYTSTVSDAITGAIRAMVARVAPTQSAFNDFTGMMVGTITAYDTHSMAGIYLSSLPTISEANIWCDAIAEIGPSLTAVSPIDFETFAKYNGVLSDFNMSHNVISITLSKSQTGMDFNISASISLLGKPNGTAGKGTISFTGTVSGAATAHFMPGTPFMFSCNGDTGLGMEIDNSGCDLVNQYLIDEGTTPTTLVGKEHLTIMASLSSETSGAIRWTDALGQWNDFVINAPILTFYTIN